MSSNKHQVTPKDAPRDDLEDNPGIGGSKGATGEDVNDIEGDNTVEGDVMNDVTRTGAVDPKQRGRTSR
ncbi:hypothetical protein [Acuticoccus sp.]|uniref:hypothetical protein n=1 Tax=Acuticoccus sp. TaxID=1904378 RepID=UPI003B519DBB